MPRRTSGREVGQMRRLCMLAVALLLMGGVAWAASPTAPIVVVLQERVMTGSKGDTTYTVPVTSLAFDVRPDDGTIVVYGQSGVTETGKLALRPGEARDLMASLDTESRGYASGVLVGSGWQLWETPSRDLVFLMAGLRMTGKEAWLGIPESSVEEYAQPYAGAFVLPPARIPEIVEAIGAALDRLWASM